MYFQPPINITDSDEEDIVSGRYYRDYFLFTKKDNMGCNW